MEQNLLTCYTLSDYHVEDWLTDLWEAKSNSDYKKKL